jgi:hypothetical protein
VFIFYYLLLRLRGISSLFDFYNLVGYIWSCGFYGDYQFDYVKILLVVFVIWFVFKFLLKCLLYFCLCSNYCGISIFV